MAALPTESIPSRSLAILRQGLMLWNFLRTVVLRIGGLRR